MAKPPDENAAANYWHLLPTTPDTSLRKVLKSNLNVSKIVNDWSRKWQQADKWKLAEVDELIRDMQDEEASVRFQAVVVCSRAAEKIQVMVEKFGKRAVGEQKHVDGRQNEAYLEMFIKQIKS